MSIDFDSLTPKSSSNLNILEKKELEVQVAKSWERFKLKKSVDKQRILLCQAVTMRVTVNSQYYVKVFNLFYKFLIN